MSPPAGRRGSDLRVAHVVRSDAFAGVERYITYVAPALARRGCGVVAIGGDPARMRDDLVEAGVRHLPAATTFEVARRLVRCGPLDLVHAHMSAAEVAAVTTSPLVRAPVVTTRHFAARRGSSLGGRLVAPAVARAVRCEIAISRFVANAIECPSVLLHSGVPARPPSQVRRPLVLMAQRLEKEKGVAVGLRAWGASGLSERGWHLVVAGGGSQASELVDLARRLGISDSVTFVGPQDDLQRLLDDASIFLSTAPAEPFGLSVVEAMACGLPVVASASGAHLETVGACSRAWLFPSGDPQACAERLRQLASDHTARSAYGRALREVHRLRFDLDAHVDRLVELYDRVFADSRSLPRRSVRARTGRRENVGP